MKKLETIKIKASQDKKFEVKQKGNTVTFVFPKDKKYSLEFFLRSFCDTLIKNKKNNIVCDLDSFDKILADDPIQSSTNLAIAMITKGKNIIEDNYVFKSNFSKPTFKFTLPEKIKNINVEAIIKGFSLAKFFQTAPSNKLGIADFVSKINHHLLELHLSQPNLPKVEIDLINNYLVKKEGMELLDAVGKGSDEPSEMIVLKFFNNPNSKDKIALVGKGIMMDTGGYCLKPYPHMSEMNQDMTGAAIVFGVIYALAATNAKVNVVGFLPLAKNLINEKAMKVSDVYKSITGRTVEIACEDAEGRLILADAIGYADKYYQPSKIITVATLTGTSERAFGDFLTPFWTTSKSTEKLVDECAKKTGEGVISLPMYPEMEEVINDSSQYADCLNSTSYITNYANGFTANWLKLFTKCEDFTHFDIAGTMYMKKQANTPLCFTLFNFVKECFNKE